jgi:hypothetical protein
MADLDSNVDAVASDIEAFLAGFNFTRPGKDQSLGRDLAVVAATGMIDQAVAQQSDPDGTPYPENEPKYRAWKKKKYSVDQPNVRTGQMLSEQSMLGGTVVGPEQVEMKYGTGNAPTSAATGAALSKQDEQITDVEKAFFCSKTRPFYALDVTTIDEMTAEAQESLDDYCKEF